MTFLQRSSNLALKVKGCPVTPRFAENGFLFVFIKVNAAFGKSKKSKKLAPSRNFIAPLHDGLVFFCGSALRLQAVTAKWARTRHVIRKVGDGQRTSASRAEREDFLIQRKVDWGNSPVFG